jgi:gamma-glutamyltranspeptidase/glutathione hydrolase
MEHFTARPELAGTFGSVATTHWLATAVGMKLLEAGSNAFDAAVATAFVLQVVEPHLNGPGGDAPILVTRHDDPEPQVICGQGPAPKAATLEAFEALDLDLVPGTGLLAACIPGAFGAWLTLLRDYGSVSLREVLAPAIGYALEGHPLLGRVAATIESVRELFLTEWPTSAAVFLSDGRTPRPDDLFRNPALGQMYARVLAHAEAAGEARDVQIEAALAYWYEGPVAGAIDRFCRSTLPLDVTGGRHPGLLRAEDLRGWRPSIEAAASVKYRDVQVFKCAAWSQGPALLQALQILEGFDIAELDPDGPDFVHLVTETLKLVMADRDAWYGDEPDAPMQALLDPAYAASRRNLIGEAASLEVRPGSPTGVDPFLAVALPRRHLAPAKGAGAGEPTSARPQALAKGGGEPQQGDTCHIDIIDRWGNMVSATPSGGWLQSSPIIPELGFALGTRMQMFDLHARSLNALAPGKRPRTTLTPTLVFKAGRPYLACGTPGGDQQEQWTLQLLLKHLDHGWPLQRAIDSPAFHTDSLYGSFWPREISPGVLQVEARYPAETIAELRRRGHIVKVGEPWSEGRLSGCLRVTDPSGAPVLYAGANPRGMQGYAIVR